MVVTTGDDRRDQHHGRAGLNIVAGWNRPEYEALGLDLPGEHERRHGYAQEWFDLVNKIWSSEGKFDWDGEFFKVSNGYGMKPGTASGCPSSMPQALAKGASSPYATPTFS